ncbi:MAG: dual specificity protein phosphatase family protein [Deltaproteobacteria bacterium]|nr:dual specificity protein phosphatase family protein [Deltaproteobacteria bacterium]
MKLIISLLMVMNSWTALKAASLADVGVAYFSRYWGLLYNQFRKIHSNGSRLEWFNEVALPNAASFPKSAKLFVGALPIHYDAISGIDYYNEMLHVGVNAVLSVVDEYEIQSREGLSDYKAYFSRFRPVTKEDWRKANVDQLHLESPDFDGVSVENLLAAAAYIRISLHDGKVIYVHCKSGVGRSVSAILAFLIRDEKMSLEEAYAYVTRYRPQAHLNAKQFEKMKEFEKIVHPNLRDTNASAQ